MLKEQYDNFQKLIHKVSYEVCPYCLKFSTYTFHVEKNKITDKKEYFFKCKKYGCLIKVKVIK